ncbi:MAG TPA: hypothetical protein VHW23_45940 [Kofleriaceae bacterium]|jgi:hypothetical protein|nr:hypothetical protein [Kofleriaceae bacterium]
MPTKKRPHRKKRPWPPATRLEGAQCLGGLPDSDINAIMLVADASERHGLPDLLEGVLRMPLLVRAKIGELLLEIQHADDEECKRRLAEGLRRHGIVEQLVAAVAEGSQPGDPDKGKPGDDRDFAHALIMSERELRDWRAGQRRETSP